MYEVEPVAALDAQELTIDAAAVAIIAAHDLVVANAQGRLAAIRAMRANRANVVHFPRPRLVAIDTAGQRAYRADVDTSAALVAFQVIVLVGNDLGDHATVTDAQR